MGTKLDLNAHEPLAAACKALSHPARIAILQALAQRGTCSCGEIVDIMPLSQATVSQHLRVLKEAGLVSGRIDGPRSCYCLSYETIRQLRSALEHLFGSIEKCC
jgi:DNA-binding transcriptional ArsR family regulator